MKKNHDHLEAMKCIDSLVLPSIVNMCDKATNTNNVVEDAERNTINGTRSFYLKKIKEMEYKHKKEVEALKVTARNSLSAKSTTSGPNVLPKGYKFARASSTSKPNDVNKRAPANLPANDKEMVELINKCESLQNENVDLHKAITELKEKVRYFSPYYVFLSMSLLDIDSFSLYSCRKVYHRILLIVIEKI